MPPHVKEEKPPKRSWVKVLVANLIITVLLIASLEGASILIFAFGGLAQEPGTENAVDRHKAVQDHTKHDPLLGWVNVPNISIPDMYGPGVSLTINSQGFRNKTDFSVGVPKGRVRIICSGDSFTIGQGVDDENSWCRQLEKLDPRLETVNMGQGGYGIDQMYLWYKRDGVKLDHDIHLFAIISADIRRMRDDKFLGHPKPILRLKDGELRLKNVPVPRPTPRLLRKLRLYLEPLKMTQLAKYVGDRFAEAQYSEKKRLTDVELIKIAGRVLDDLMRLNSRKNSIPVFVFLPTKWDYDHGRSGPGAWRRGLRREAEKRGMYFIDLLKPFLTLNPKKAKEAFLLRDVKGLGGCCAGHYSNAGNAFIAKNLYAEILALPRVRQRLGEIKSAD